MDPFQTWMVVSWLILGTITAVFMVWETTRISDEITLLDVLYFLLLVACGYVSFVITAVWTFARYADRIFGVLNGVKIWKR